MITRIILFTLGFYILYKLVFDLILPIFRATQQVKRQFGDMQQRMQDQMNAQQNGYPNNAPIEPKPTETQKSKAGDYIDFEEVK